MGGYAIDRWLHYVREPTSVTSAASDVDEITFRCGHEISHFGSKRRGGRSSIDAIQFAKRVRVAQSKKRQIQTQDDVVWTDTGRACDHTKSLVTLSSGSVAGQSLGLVFFVVGDFGQARNLDLAFQSTHPAGRSAQRVDDSTIRLVICDIDLLRVDDEVNRYPTFVVRLSRDRR